MFTLFMQILYVHLKTKFLIELHLFIVFMHLSDDLIKRIFRKGRREVYTKSKA